MLDTDTDRRGLLGLGAALALLFGRIGSAHAAEAGAKEVAPGVTVRVLKETESMIEGAPKIRLREITFAPGSTLGPTKMPNAMICEITQAPLEQSIEGQSTRTLQPGDIYACHPGMVETDVNRGSAPCVMRVFDLLPA